MNPLTVFCTWCRVIDSGLVGSTRAEDAQGTPTQSHVSPNILVYEDKGLKRFHSVEYEVFVGPRFWGVT